MRVLFRKTLLISFFSGALVWSNMSFAQEETRRLFRLHSGVGYSFFRGEPDDVNYHMGGRILANVNRKQSYGIEVTYFDTSRFGGNRRDPHYLAVGIVLEQKLGGWFLMSIGTVGYIHLKQSSSHPFGIVTNLGWEPETRGRLVPFITYRSDWIFDQPILSSNAISLGFGILF